MPRKRRLNRFTAGELNMTAMIDVAFQLLCFFLIAAHPTDVLTNLSVARPTIDSQPGGSDIRITVFPDGYSVNECRMDASRMSTLLKRLADLDPTQTVLIQCLNESPHSRFVEVLDTCAKAKLTNLSVVSSGGG